MIRLFLIFAVPCALLIYAPALEAPLYLDDATVLANARIDFMTRALGFASFWFNNQVNHVIGPAFPWKMQFYYRFGNVIIHILAATALFWLARELSNRWKIASAAATLFLIHPIQTQAVTYISQRFESQATMFLLLSGAAYARFRNLGRSRWFVLSIISGIAAGLTKETAVVLPAWILLIEAIFFDWRQIWKRAPYLLLLGAALAVPALKAFWGAGTTLTSIPVSNYLASQGYALSKYLQLVVWPRRLFLFYDVPFAERLTLELALQWLVVLALAGIGVYCLRRNRLIAFGILSFFVVLLPVIVLPLPDLIFEHRMYPAMAGVSLAVAAALQMLNTRVAAACFVIASIPLAYRTFERNREWQDPVRFLEMHRERFPESPLILTNLSAQYANRGRIANALDASNAARKFEKRANSYYIRHVATVTAMNLGFQHLQTEDYQSARDEANRAMKLDPGTIPPYWLMSAIDVTTKDFAAAQRNYKKILQIDPVNMEAWQALLMTMNDLGDDGGASIAAARIQKIKTVGAQIAPRPFMLPQNYRKYVVYFVVVLSLGAVAWSVSTVWKAAGASTSLVREWIRRPRGL